jgi:hypothetical protein
MNGVKVTEKPQINVDEWLNPSSPQSNPTLADAIFHYSARASSGERFEVCIATDEMNAAAWKYGYENQIILDGTFGVCDSRLLLFIVMAIDENRKGIPVAFLMFSAPTGNKQSSSGYDTGILTKLLGAWKEAVTKCGEKHSFPGVIFCPFTCITDADLKERGALLAVFPSIWLLICRFHLRQSWKNHRNKLLKGKKRLKLDLKHRLKRLEDSLVKTQTVEEARTLLSQERDLLTQLGDGKTILNAIAHVDYLNDYWTSDNLWKSWSDFGRKVAASLLGCEMDGVIPTTNHLESFNGVLKRKHLRRWQNGGRRIRVDVLIQVLVIHILPSIFQERRLYREQEQRIADQVRQLPGGAKLAKNQAGRQIIPKIAYLVPDDQRTERALALLAANQIGVPDFVAATNTFVFACYSSEALEIDTQPVQYKISMGLDGVVTCTCPDFDKHGGACKHIRGGLLFLDKLRAHGLNIPMIPIPMSLTDAHALQTKTAIHRAEDSAASMDRPTVPAAAAISDLLQEQVPEQADDEETTHSPKDTDETDDETDIDTDVSSDDDDDDPLERVPGNLAALGEQALARTVHELQDIGPRLGDLADFMKQKTGPLSAAEHNALSTGRGHLAALLGELDWLLFSAPLLTQNLPSSSSSVPPTQMVLEYGSKKRKHAPDRTLQPPSPEKRAQKRHESYAPY